MHQPAGTKAAMLTLPAVADGNYSLRREAAIYLLTEYCDLTKLNCNYDSNLTRF